MTSECPNLYLVGMMGAGKTTVGRQLAKRFGRQFVDADHEIEARTGVAVATIFEIEGESGFRKREAQVISDLAQTPGLVVATGGGVVLDSENRRAMRESGIVVYLDATPSLLYERTRHDRNRPLLRVADPLAKLRELHALRDPLYREIAHIIVGAAAGSVGNLVNLVEKEIRARCAP